MPPALRITFGTQNLGIIYGLLNLSRLSLKADFMRFTRLLAPSLDGFGVDLRPLRYVGVAIFEPLWSLLFHKPQGCARAT